MATSKRPKLQLPLAFTKSREELENLDKFDEYIGKAQSTDKATVTKNINLAARVATRDLLSHQALKHVVECIKFIAKEPHSHKETAIFLVDSILVHAAHYCEEHLKVRFINRFSPMVVGLFKRAMSANHGRFRNALSAKFLKKILPKWREHRWFSGDVLKRVQDICLKKAPQDVKQAFKEFPPVNSYGDYGGGPDDDALPDVENEESKVNVEDAVKTIKRWTEMRKAGAINPATPRPGVMTPGTPGMPPPAVHHGATTKLAIRSDILNAIPSTPMVKIEGAPATPRANQNLLSAIPQTPIGAGLGVPQTPRQSPFGMPGTPNVNMAPGTPSFARPMPIPGTPSMPGLAVPGTPQVSTMNIPRTPAGAMGRGQPFTPAPFGAQMMSAGAAPTTPAGAFNGATPRPQGQPFTPGMPGIGIPRTPVNAMPRGQPFTPARPGVAQPFTPVGAKAMGTPVQIPRTPFGAVARGTPMTGQPFTPAGPGRQPFTPGMPVGQPMTPAAARVPGPFTPAMPARGQPFTPAMAGLSAPLTPAGAMVGIPRTPAAAFNVRQPFTPAPFAPQAAAMTPAQGAPMTPAAAQFAPQSAPTGGYTPSSGGLPAEVETKIEPKKEPQDDTPFLQDGAGEQTPGGEQTPAAPPEEGTPGQAGEDTPVPHTLSREAEPSVPLTEEGQMLDLPTPRLPDGMETPMAMLDGSETPNVRVPELPPPAKKAKLDE